MQTVLLAVGILALGIAGIAIKILVKKDGKFSGGCASNNPMFNEEGKPCGFCGAMPDEQCKKDTEVQLN